MTAGLLPRSRTATSARDRTAQSGSRDALPLPLMYCACRSVPAHGSGKPRGRCRLRLLLFPVSCADGLAARAGRMRAPGGSGHRGGGAGSPVVGEVAGGYRLAGDVQPPLFPLPGALGWLIGGAAVDVIDEQGPHLPGHGRAGVCDIRAARGRSQLQPEHPSGSLADVRHGWLLLAVAGIVAGLAGCGGHSPAPSPGGEAHRSPSPARAATPSPPGSTVTPTTSASPVTSVVHVAPVGSLEQPIPGLPVSQTLDGSCVSGSDSVQGPVYRCFSGNYVYDPCWAVATAKIPTATVLCMTEPWQASVVKIVTPGLPGVSAASGTDLDFPWAVQLTTGQRCLAVQGAHGDYKGKAIDFGCQNSGLELLRGVDRSRALWSYQSVQQNGSALAPGPAVYVSIAWFGGPS